MSPDISEWGPRIIDIRGGWGTLGLGYEFNIILRFVHYMECLFNNNIGLMIKCIYIAPYLTLSQVAL